jgi:hypothetical protein
VRAKRPIGAAPIISAPRRAIAYSSPARAWCSQLRETSFKVLARITRRVDRAAGEDYLAADPGMTDHTLLPIFETDRAAALEQDAVRQGADLDPQVGPLQRRTQIGNGSTAPPLVAHGQLQWTHPILLGAVEIVVPPVAGLLRGGDEGVVEFVAGPQIAHVERPAGTVMRVGAALLVFGAPEIGQHVVVGPAGVAELAPQLKILALPADVNEPVDRARPAEHLAARPGRPPSSACGSVSNCQVILGW